MRGAITYAQANADRLHRDIDNARQLYGYTQEQAGECIGIGQAGYSRLISGRKLDVSELCELACEYGLEVRLCDRLQA